MKVGGHNSRNAVSIISELWQQQNKKRKRLLYDYLTALFINTVRIFKFRFLFTFLLKAVNINLYFFSLFNWNVILCFRIWKIPGHDFRQYFLMSPKYFIKIFFVYLEATRKLISLLVREARTGLQRNEYHRKIK